MGIEKKSLSNPQGLQDYFRTIQSRATQIGKRSGIVVRKEITKDSDGFEDLDDFWEDEEELETENKKKFSFLNQSEEQPSTILEEIQVTEEVDATSSSSSSSSESEAEEDPVQRPDRSNVSESLTDGIAIEVVDGEVDSIESVDKNENSPVQQPVTLEKRELIDEGNSDTVDMELESLPSVDAAAAAAPENVADLPGNELVQQHDSKNSDAKTKRKSKYSIEIPPITHIEAHNNESMNDEHCADDIMHGDASASPIVEQKVPIAVVVKRARNKGKHKLVHPVAVDCSVAESHKDMIHNGENLGKESIGEINGNSVGAVETDVSSPSKSPLSQPILDLNLSTPVLSKKKIMPLPSFNDGDSPLSSIKKKHSKHNEVESHKNCIEKSKSSFEEDIPILAKDASDIEEKDSDDVEMDINFDDNDNSNYITDDLENTKVKHARNNISDSSVERNIYANSSVNTTVGAVDNTPGEVSTFNTTFNTPTRYKTKKRKKYRVELIDTPNTEEMDKLNKKEFGSRDRTDDLDRTFTFSDVDDSDRGDIESVNSSGNEFTDNDEGFTDHSTLNLTHAQSVVNDLGDENNSGLRRSTRQRFKPLAFYKNERLVYERPNRGIGRLIPTVAGVERTGVKTPMKTERVTKKNLAVSKSSPKKRKFPMNELPSQFKYRKVSWSRVWDERSKKGKKMNLIMKQDQIITQKLPPVDNLPCALAGQYFNSPGFDNYPSWISGVLVLPPKSAKRAEVVSDCIQVHNVISCQPDSIEVAYGFPDGNSFKPETAERHIVSNGDEYYIPPNNSYCLHNHSEDTTCRIRFMILKKVK